jgi:sterol desaturase/sphingolipid hydroxylase (fatty acid hydroxylase superfamily)
VDRPGRARLMAENANILGYIQLATGVALFIALVSLETLYPFFQDRRQRVRHNACNLALGLLNGVILACATVLISIRVCTWTKDNHLGLLNLFSAPQWVIASLALVLLDAWMYLWHRLNHTSKFLWRFHRMHHSDSQMDASTALRFHPGEMLFGALLRISLVPILGLELWNLVLYDTILIPVILFHHSNVNLPQRWDRVVRVIIVTPFIHRVHHSQIAAETNSNYSSIFSFWDRLARTLLLRDDPRSIQLGLPEFWNSYWQTIVGMIKTPFVDTGKGRGRHNTATKLGHTRA